MAGRQWRMSKASRLKGPCNRLVTIYELAATKGVAPAAVQVQSYPTTYALVPRRRAGVCWSQCLIRLRRRSRSDTRPDCHRRPTLRWHWSSQAACSAGHCAVCKIGNQHESACRLRQSPTRVYCADRRIPALHLQRRTLDFRFKRRGLSLAAITK